MNLSWLTYCKNLSLKEAIFSVLIGTGFWSWKEGMYSCMFWKENKMLELVAEIIPQSLLEVAFNLANPLWNSCLVDIF